MTKIALDIMDNEICETLYKYGKIIGYEITDNSIYDFKICHENDYFKFIDSNNQILHNFQLPVSLFELESFLSRILLKKQNTLLKLNERYFFDFYNRIIIDKYNVDAICELTEKESEMLKFIIDSKETGADKDELLQQVWGYNVNTQSRTVEVHLYRLRQKLTEFSDDILKIAVDRGRCFLT